MHDEPKHYPDLRDDRLGLVVRGVCGAILGLGMAAAIWMRCAGVGPWGTAALFAGAVVACMVGSIRYGDDFWYGLLRR